jgi:hypothetical protein
MSKGVILLQGEEALHSIPVSKIKHTPQGLGGKGGGVGVPLALR